MARFSRAASLAFSAAIRDAYEAGSHNPLSAFESIYGSKMPKWAVKTAADVRSNINILVTQAQVELNSPFEGGMVPIGTAFSDALLEVGSIGSGELRTARVYTVLNMTYADYIAGVDAIMADWMAGYGGELNPPPRLLEPIWRIR